MDILVSIVISVMASIYAMILADKYGLHKNKYIFISITAVIVFFFANIMIGFLPAGSTKPQTIVPQDSIPQGPKTSEFSFRTEMQSSLKEKFSKLQSRVKNIQTDFITINFTSFKSKNFKDHERTKIRKIREEVPLLAIEYETINDVELTPAYQILKYDNLAYIKTIFAELESTMDSKKKYIRKAALDLKNAFSILKDVKNSHDRIDNDYIVRLKIWITKNDTESRLYYLASWLNALKYKISGNELDCENCKKDWAKIEDKYKQEFPASEHPSLYLCIK